MIILLSPAKTFTKSLAKGNKNPYFLPKTMVLVEVLKSFTTSELEKKLNISAPLATTTYHYYKNFNLTYLAAYLYGGQAYKYLKAEEINQENLKKLYILSPLYGILNALDNISLYRLDIKDKIIKQSLYDYWYDDINNLLNNLNKTIINLASGEFSKLLDLTNKSIYTINFAEIKNNKLVQQSMLIKKMRGMMANYLLVNEINEINLIKQITLDGFSYNKNYSNNNLLMFTK